MGTISGGEVLLLIFLGIIILGPDKLPGYAAKLANLVRSLREMAEGARTQLREEMGPAFDEVNWSQLDPRQYDPRRIVREALTSPPQPNGAAAAAPRDALDRAGRPVDRAGRPARRAVVRAPDPELPTPFDTDAT